jgi:hypothetical protein
MHQEEGSIYFLDTMHKQWGLLTKMVSKPYLKCSITNWFTLHSFDINKINQLIRRKGIKLNGR